MKLYYFGCGPRDIGHHWFDGENYMPGHEFRKRVPWRYGHEDSGFCPPGAQVQGVVNHVQVSGWSVVAWWDRSADKRPGSNSAFVAEGTFGELEMIAAAREQYPWVFARMKFEVP